MMCLAERVAEQLAEGFLVPRQCHVSVDQLNEVPLGVAGESGFGEVGVLRQEGIPRGTVHVGEVAPPTARDADFLTRSLGVIDDQHMRPGAACAAHIMPAAPAPMIKLSPPAWQRSATSAPGRVKLR